MGEEYRFVNNNAKEFQKLRRALDERTKERDAYAKENGRMGIHIGKLVKENEALQAKLEAEQVKRVNDYADAGRLVAWILNDARKPANIAFTEGPERQVAYAFEAKNEALQEKLRSAESLVGQYELVIDREDKAIVEDVQRLEEKLWTAYKALRDIRDNPQGGGSSPWVWSRASKALGAEERPNG